MNEEQKIQKNYSIYDEKVIVIDNITFDDNDNIVYEYVKDSDLKKNIKKKSRCCFFNKIICYILGVLLVLLLIALLFFLFFIDK